MHYVTSTIFQVTWEESTRGYTCLCPWHIG